MIIDNSEQGSLEWHQIRLGKATASCFSKIITSQGKASTSAKTYMHELLAEWLSGKMYDGYSNDWMDRGNEIEAEARDFYEYKQDVDVLKVGFCLIDEGSLAHLVGASPDGMIGDDGLLEMKCPKHSTHIKYLLAGKLPTEYFQQVQGQLMVTGRKWCDFMAYHPDFKPLLVRVNRDEDFITELHAKLVTFCKEMLTQREKLKRLNETA